MGGQEFKFYEMRALSLVSLAHYTSVIGLQKLIAVAMKLEK